MTPAVSPSLMQIRAFLYVVETGSISRAAAALFRAQSAVTRSIISLESSLGIPIFERSGNGMRLTRQGASILPRAKRAVAELLYIRRFSVGRRKGQENRFICSRIGVLRYSLGFAKSKTCKPLPWRSVFLNRTSNSGSLH